MTVFELTFEANVYGMLGLRRVSAKLRAKSREDALEKLAADYTNMTNVVFR